MPDWREPAAEDEGEPLPRWVAHRWASWGFGLIILTVGAVATSHRGWTIPAALAIASIIVGLHYVWWPDIQVSRGTPPATPNPRSEPPDPDARENDIVIVRRKIE